MTAARRSPEDWQRLTGHVPRRMDPVNRALWWRATDPATAAKTRWFMNWHEFYALLLSGRPVVDWSDAGTWATYDVATAAWSPERIAETGIDPRWLPEIQPNGTPIGPILPDAAEAFGLPADTLIVTGAFDTYAASVGSAAVDPGIVSLACGTWNSFNMAVTPGWPAELVHEGIGVYPHPGPTGFGLAGHEPQRDGASSTGRGRCCTSRSPTSRRGSPAADRGPGHVFADAAFTPLPHVSASPGFGGTFSGVTLAATAVDIVRALLEGIACEFSLTLDRLRLRGIESRLVRATGGGSKNAWWLQLMADLSRHPGRGRRPGGARRVRCRDPGRRRCRRVRIGLGGRGGAGHGVAAVRARSRARRALCRRPGRLGGGDGARQRCKRRCPPQPAPMTALSTPALVVDLDVFEANVAAMAAMFAGTGKTLRPHVKTHRTPELARRQLGGPAVGITCATVGEAEAMVDAGIDDVLVANEVVDPRKIARLVALARRARMGVAVDDPEPVAALSREAVRAGVTIDVLIDVDILLHRCGVASAAEAVRLAEPIERAPGLRLRGIMGYEGRLRLNDG